MTNGPTLTDARGMGGLAAQDGFDYQVWDALVRLPGWVKYPAFEGLLIEGLEDFEARYFAPHAPKGHLLDRFQAKATQLTKAEIEKVIESFREFDDKHPRAARVQVLVTTALPTTLNWLARDPDRVRKARPFYAPFADITAASDNKLRIDLAGTFEACNGYFFANAVDVQLRNYSERATAHAAFGAALTNAFPDLDFSSRRIAETFEALANLASRSRGAMLTREQLIAVLEDKLAVSVSRTILPLHIRGDQSPERVDALEIDARVFSQAPFPPQDGWQDQLLRPLGLTAAWAKSLGITRVGLSGQFRISLALGIGWAFRAATGFELEIPTRDALWTTDQRPAHGDTVPMAVSDANELSHDRLAVAVGVLRDPVPGILASGNTPEMILSLHFDQPIADGVMAQLAVRQIKTAISAAVNRLQPKGIDLYFAGPAALAVALGHRWNALPSTRLHEFDQAVGRYAATCVLG